MTRVATSARPCPPPALFLDPSDRVADRPDGRTVVRDWTDQDVWISTVCPDRGEIPRGRLRVVPDGWEWTDITCRAGVHRGDFLDAERVLLDVTALLDRPACG